jgi:hypothetical protein
MTIQLSATVRDARLDAIEAAIGASAIMRIRSGAPPANVGLADTGTVLATIALPADWMLAASNGVKSISGTWSDLSADAPGTAGHFRIYSSGGTCHLQGTITATGGGGDMELDGTVFAATQEFSITSFDLNEPNA